MIETAQSFLGMMKYVCNHPYKFGESTNGVFAMIFSSFFVTMEIEIANILVLMMTGDPLSLISNFVSLVVITQFD
jgi:hypothetical protein